MSLWKSPSRAETASGRKTLEVRWVFTVLMVFLMLAGALFPTLAYYQSTNHYTGRVGLNGESWYADAFPAEYPAMHFYATIPPTSPIDAALSWKRTA